VRQLIGRQIEGYGRLACGIGQVVAERGDHRPGQLFALQVLIHQQAGADVGVGVDVRVEVRMDRNVARLMMVEVAYMRACFEQSVQRVAILRQCDIEHGNAVARLRLDSFQQADIALGSGHQFRIGRVGQAQLVQRADAVGITVENIDLQAISLSVFWTYITSRPAQAGSGTLSDPCFR